MISPDALSRVISAALPRRLLIFGDVNFQAWPLPEFSVNSPTNLSFVRRNFSDGHGHKFDFALMPRRVRNGITLNERVGLDVTCSFPFPFSLFLFPFSRFLFPFALRRESSFVG